MSNPKMTQSTDKFFKIILRDLYLDKDNPFLLLIVF